MEEIIETQETVESPIVEVKEFSYEYQPADDHGRPLGGKQRFKGTSEREVTEKIARAHVEAMKEMRELKRKNRLGIVDTEDISPNAPKLDEEEIEPLTMEQRLERLEAENMALRARAEAELFRQKNPSYFACPENFETIANWMIKNNLAPVCANFEYAFLKLSEAGLLLSAPIVREEITPVVTKTTPEIQVNTKPEVVEESRITNTEQPQPTRVARPASGLNKSVISGNEAPVVSVEKAIDQITYTTKSGVTYKGNKALDMMPADEYRKLLKDPNFKKLVDTTSSEASAS